MTAELDTRPRSSRTPTRKTLMQKYDIPLNHLEFEYIEKCSNGKEMEQIVKILRSNEEGYYPDLLKCAEERLRSIHPISRLLRVETRPLDRKSLSKEEWKATVNDIDEWSEKMKNKEKSLSITNNNNKKSSPMVFPEVRKTVDANNKAKQPLENGKTEKPIRLNSCNYKAWDKYNADLDCLKMDLEDMKKEEEEKKAKEIAAHERLSQACKTIEESAVASLDQAQLDLLSDEEKQDFAVEEKVKGNEYYSDKLFEKAIWYYTRSILIHPNLLVYNNRAACYLALSKFSLALQDLNKVIEKEPDNIKARHRRAQALQHLNRFEEALEDTRLVLSKKPDYALAKIMADKLRENCATLPKIHRLVVKDKETGGSRYCEVTEEELGNRTDIHVLVNEFGLPVTACQCHTKQTSSTGRRRVPRMGGARYQPPTGSAVSSESKNEVIVLKDKVSISAPEKSSGSGSSVGGSGGGGDAKKINIIELERIVEEDKADDLNRVGVVTKTVVTDKRTAKAQNPVIGDEKCEKIHKNEVIKQEQTMDNQNESKKEVKTSKNMSIQEERLRVDQKSEMTPECLSIGPPRPCGCQTDYPPFHFKSAWQRVDSEEYSLTFKAQLLKSICPQHLSKAFGNSWESDTLIDIFRCLRYHFDLTAEKARVASYLEAVFNFSRFKINFSFLNQEGKKLAQELLEIIVEERPQLKAAIQEEIS